MTELLQHLAALIAAAEAVCAADLGCERWDLLCEAIEAAKGHLTKADLLAARNLFAARDV